VFERFLNESRKGWPDIDLDLPSGDRRESVIQEIYRRYGKSATGRIRSGEHGAAMTGERDHLSRSQCGARDWQSAQLFPEHHRPVFASVRQRDFPHTMELEAQIEAAGLPKHHPRMPAFIRLYHAIYGLPRHLGQHSGGMIICRGRLSSFVPLENASMPAVSWRNGTRTIAKTLAL